MLAGLGGVEGLKALCHDHHRQLASTPGLEREAREFLQAMRRGKKLG
jgi:hypothetical protein